MTDLEKDVCIKMMGVLAGLRKLSLSDLCARVLSVHRGALDSETPEGDEHFIIITGLGNREPLTMDIYTSLADFQGFTNSWLTRHNFFISNDREMDYWNPHFQVVFVGKDAIDPDQRAAFIASQKEIGKRVGGSYPYPFVLFYDGHHAPTEDLTVEQMDMIREDVEILLGGIRTTYLHTSFEHHKNYYRICLTEEGYTCDLLPWTYSISMEKPKLSLLDKKALEQVQSLEREGDYFACLYPWDEPVLLPEDPEEVFPFVLYVGKFVNRGEDKRRLFRMVFDPEKEKEKILDELLNYFIKNGSVPESINVDWADQYIQCILKGFCRKLKIHYKTKFDCQQCTEDIAQYVEKYESSHVPEQGEEEPLCSYVIRVSLDSSCYRDIQITEATSLDSLAEAIVHSFGFDMDHMFSFTLPQLRGRTDVPGVFFSSPGSDEVDKAWKVRISDINFKKGSTFRFIYDFGDYWTFSCKVLKVTDDMDGIWKLVGGEGEAPEQYGDW